VVAQVDSNFVKLSCKKTYTRFLSYLFFEGRPLTTRGRWINPLVFFLYRLHRYLPFARQVKAPIFILGIGRSGTTILGVTLAMHDAVGFLNEPKALWSYLYPEEDIIGNYNLNDARYRLSDTEVNLEMIRKAHRILGNYLTLSCSYRVVDKYPELVFRLDFVRAIFPDAKFLFLYRNGIDTCCSIKAWSHRLGVNVDETSHDWWGLNDRKWTLLCDQIVATDLVLGPHIDKIRLFSAHEHRAAVEWIVTMKEGMRLATEYPDKVLPVKYENYTMSLNARKKVLDFCDLPPDKRYDEYCSKVLKKPVEMESKIALPEEIESEFIRVMGMLGYE
jgi:hypothetical protein|tara:strand:- start:3104 stop:4099 length:996 start_codon:yes stop_codon:yes gene_type:complete